MAFLIQFPRVHLDFGAVRSLPAELAALGITRPLLLTDRGLVACGALARVRDTVAGRNDIVVFDEVPENPTVDGVNRAIGLYRSEGCDGIVALGGGSVIDTAKAVAVVAGHPGPVTDYMGKPDSITHNVAPLIAVPTTAGTGSEASRGAGIHPDAKSRSNGLNSHYIVPRVAICDPELTASLPPRLTAGTGMDALSHCVEAFLTTSDNPPGKALALDGVRHVVSFIERAVKDGNDREARKGMMIAALEGGMAIHMGLGPVHAIANATGDQGLHHGMMVTIAMPTVMRLLSPHMPEKMAILGEALGGKPEQNPADMVEALNARLGIPPNLRALGYNDPDFDDMAADCAKSHFLGRSPYRPSAAEFKSMLRTIVG
ncbi:MAG TPA: iron-containing alcohol dehydrogenase [Stellaceae bacterium]|nr:iron-containing alcohol dehydrogenase [Stellaceae bacterium]